MCGAITPLGSKSNAESVSLKYAHYTADHADVMAAMADKPKSEGEKWMADAKARFEAVLGLIFLVKNPLKTNFFWGF